MSRGARIHVPGVTEALAEGIRRARNRAGLSGVDLALRLGVTPQAVSAVERGRVAVTVEALVAIADAVGIHPATLLARLRPIGMAQVTEHDALAAAVHRDVDRLPRDQLATLRTVIGALGRAAAAAQAARAAQGLQVQQPAAAPAPADRAAA